MRNPQRSGLSDESKQEALASLFPPSTEPEQLSMVSRTPPDMVLSLVFLEVIEAALDYTALQERKYKEADEKGEEALVELYEENADFIDPEDADLDEYEDVVAKKPKTDTENINLIRVFRMAFDRRMISKNGLGRSEMMEILMGAGDGEDNIPSISL